MSNDDKCPCVDGLPDPCTLCGAPADGVCEIDTLVGWKHRAQRAEAEARQLREAIEIQAERPIPTLPSRWTEDEKVSYRSGWLDRTEHMRDALSFWDAPAAVAEGAEGR